MKLFPAAFLLFLLISTCRSDPDPEDGGEPEPEGGSGPDSKGSAAYPDPDPTLEIGSSWPPNNWNRRSVFVDFWRRNFGQVDESAKPADSSSSLTSASLTSSSSSSTSSTSSSFFYLF